MLIVDKKFSNKLISILFESQYNFFVKSLIRSLTSVPSDLSVALDQSRWKDELVLMKYYYDIKNNRSMAACLAPIIIINKDIEKMMDVLEDIYKIMYGNNNINVKFLRQIFNKIIHHGRAASQNNFLNSFAVVILK